MSRRRRPTLGWSAAEAEAAMFRRLDHSLQQIHDVAALCEAANGGEAPDWMDDQVRVARALTYAGTHMADQIEDRAQAAEICARLRTWCHTWRPA